MAPPRPLLLALVLVLLAGCLGDEPLPEARTFAAAGGTVSAGWAYDGTGVVGREATIGGVARNVDNTAVLTADWMLDGAAWRAQLVQVTPTADFQDGGVAFDLVEHGDSGVADASIPRILAKVALWGTAQVTRNGVPVLAPSGGDAWSAHLMVSDTTVRGADGRILKSDGATPYDPATPGDARRLEGDPQAFLVLRGPDGPDAVREPVVFRETYAFAGPERTQSATLPATPGAAVVLNVTADGGSAPVGVGTVTVRLLDEEGAELGTRSGEATPAAPFAASFEVPDATGPLTVEIVGQGVFTATVDALVSFRDLPFLVLTWNDVTLTDGASDVAAFAD